jgi:hypothetical protein
MKNYELKISQFVDNELPENEQKELFQYLSESQEARKILIDFTEIKGETKSFYTVMNAEMDELKNAIPKIAPQKEKKYKTMFYYSVAASIIFALLFLINQFKENTTLVKYKELQSEMIVLQDSYSDALNKQTELLYINNQLYVESQKLKTTKVAEGDKLDTRAQRDEQSMTKKQNKDAGRRSNSSVNTSRMLASLNNVQTITITKNDFIGGQIIGN